MENILSINNNISSDNKTAKKNSTHQLLTTKAGKTTKKFSPNIKPITKNHNNTSNNRDPTVHTTVEKHQHPHESRSARVQLRKALRALKRPKLFSI